MLLINENSRIKQLEFFMESRKPRDIISKVLLHYKRRITL